MEIDISSYLKINTIKFLESDNRNEIIWQLIESTAIFYKFEPHKEEFFEAVLEREKTASTGIGLGVALPHAKLSCFDDFFIAIALLNKGINWNSMDKMDVRLVFLIGGPDDKHNEYLDLLSALTLFLRKEMVRKKLLQATNAREVIELFQTLKE